MAKIFIEESSLTAIADAIRAKTGSTEALTVPTGMVNAINSIESGGGSGDADATEQKMAELISGWIDAIENKYVYTIRDEFFKGYTELASVNFANCSFVGKSGFEGCTYLQEAYLPSVTTIDQRGFYGCTALRTANFTALQQINDYGFYECRSLQTLVLPNIQSIGTEGLYGCGSLTKLDLGPNFSNWGEDCLYSCPNLETLIIRTSGYTIQLPSFLAYTKIGTGDGYIYVPASLLQDYINNEEFEDVSFASQLRAIEDYPTITGG